MIFSFTSFVCKTDSSLRSFSSRLGLYHRVEGSVENYFGLDDAHPGAADPLDHGADGDDLPAAVEQLDPVPLLTRQLAHQDRLAVADPLFLLRVGGHLGEGEGDLVEGDPGAARRLA